MAIGRTFGESLQKALRSLDTGLDGLDEIEIEGLGLGDDMNVLRAALGPPHARPAACGRRGAASWHAAWRDLRGLRHRSVVHRARRGNSRSRSQGSRAWFAWRRGQFANVEGGGVFRCASFRASLAVPEADVSGLRKKSSACTRCSKRDRHLRGGNFPRLRLICIRPTRRLLVRRPPANRTQRRAGKSSFWAAVRTGSGRASEFDYCCCHASFALREAVSRRSWSTAIPRRYRPIMILPTGSISNP